MSRYVVDAKNPRFDVTVGWDRPLTAAWVSPGVWPVSPFAGAMTQRRS